jgi:hypothetical protein
MKIRLNRSSVHPGDDIDSHEKLIDVSDSTTLHEFMSNFMNHFPLPGIWGGQATWILEGNKILAVLAQQWAGPKYFVLHETLVSELIERDAKYRGELHFHYWVQDDPNVVFDEIWHTGKLPAVRGYPSKNGG